MEKGQGKGTDTLPTDNVFTRKEYIEREKLRDALYDADAITMRGVAILNRFPAADVVARDCYDRLLFENDELRKERPVVRCGECIYCEWKNEDCTYGWCKRISTFKMRGEYCSDGERGESDGE